MKTKLAFVCGTVMTLLALAACGAPNNVSQEGEGKPKVKDPDPVTLKLFAYNPMSESDFKKLIAEPVKKKYPYITVELLSKNSTQFESTIAAKEDMDLILMWNGSVNSNKQYGIFEDMTPHARKAGFDFGRFDPKAMETIKELSDKGEIYGVPYQIQFYALYYNKDLFDKFGVPYPKDGMTWEDTVELTRKMSRMQDGVQYSGFDTDTLSRFTYPLSLVPVDGKTDKVLVNSDAYKKAFELGKQLYSIPDNPGKLSTGRFTKEKTLAMVGTVNLFDQLEKTPDLNWDMVQFPSYKEKPNTYGMYDLNIVMMTSTSKHKDEAMKAIEVFLSDEVQTLSSTMGKLSALTNPEIRKQFGIGLPMLKGKNLQGIFKSSPAYAPPFSMHHSKGNEILKKTFLDYIGDKKDVNTALRDAEEEITRYIKSQGTK
ncbi:extracellular solute-binding protein [Paenibacillus sp. H1-7]|uniref:ABC transporter substrate-binding protein n=1 Tax=Paenibacillus sp. H1-7 TaxID=2282849 RepID=UPI001EF9813A|nr:extracellular solute-binding protein [Paenibacillus sp. H1-7]ULL13848.1 extracellular solute-binding protein [Paenibacillus sp. H1-7]